MRVFVTLYWFWEGDSYLVNSYVGVRSNLHDAVELAIKESESKSSGKNLIFMPGREIPLEGNGTHSSEGFYQILAEPIDFVEDKQ